MPDLPNPGRGRTDDLSAAAISARESASLLLVESLIHGLIERSVLTVSEALEIIEIAAAVERELHESGDNADAKFKSFLAPLAHSLTIDLAPQA